MSQQHEANCCGSETVPATVANASCHSAEEAAGDSCCETPARRDYFFWVCLVVVGIAYPLGALNPHDHESVLGVFSAPSG